MKNGIKKMRAFTLIELLVVMAIIGVLASIVVVNLNKTQARSRDAKRIADLHALQSAFLMYKDDHKHLPLNNCSGAYCSIPPYDNCPYDSECTGETQGTCPGPSYNCNKAFLRDLLAGNYIDHLPQDPTPTKYTYYYYHDMGGGRAALISNLESIDANTVQDAFVIPDSAPGAWGCKMNSADTAGNMSRQNSYCVALK